MVKPVKHVTDWMVIADRLWATPCNESGVKDDSLRAGERVIRTSTVQGQTPSVCESRNTIYILHVPHPDTEKMTQLVVGYGLVPAKTATAVANAMIETTRAWMILHLVRQYGDARVNYQHWRNITVDQLNDSPALVSARGRVTDLLERIGRELGAKSLAGVPAQGENHG